jgi:lysophospholipase L1-like esterase
MTAWGRLLSGLIAVVIALAGFVTVGAPTAAAGSTGTLQYVALGDSYAAGIGAPPYHLTDGCSQSKKGYPTLLDRKPLRDRNALLDRKVHIDLQVNATCPGATTSTVAGTQLSALTPGVELVTLTVGGNDLGFVDLAETCLTPGQELQCLDAIADAVTEQQLTALGSALTELYGQVADAAPNALIVVTGYPYLFEPDPNNPIITAFNAATAALNTTIETAVNATDNDNIIYVGVTAQFKGHRIGSDDPFINGPTAGFPEAFHPNAAGYRAYAKAISAAIRDALDRQEQLA